MKTDTNMLPREPVNQEQPGPVAVKDLMLVDADSDISSLVSSLFERENWAVHKAPNNQVALEWARAKSFQLIITSDKTPAVADVTLLRRIRATRPHTRLIILTGESTPADVISAMRNHAFCYFSKPFALDELSNMIGRAMKDPCWDDGIEVISATPEWIHVTARCDLATADRMVQFLNEMAELPDPERGHVALGFRELLLNAIEHGAGLDPTKDVDIEYVRARRMVVCRISDPGPGFTLDEIPHAAIANPTNDPLRHITIREQHGMRPGGYGVVMAQQLLDQVVYGERGNDVLLIKYLDPDTGSPL